MNGEAERASEVSEVGYTRRKNTKSRREEAWNAKRRKGALKPAGGGRGRGAAAAAAAAVVAAAAAVSAAVAGRATRLSRPRRSASLSLSHHRYPPPASTRSFRLSLSPPTGGGGQSRACAVPARRDDQGGEGKITTAYPPPTAACSPARLFARSLARSLPRLASLPATKKSDHPLACTTCPTRFALLLFRAPREPCAPLDPRECPCEGWRALHRARACQ